MHNRQYDIILWGATGFTGRLVAEYLGQKYPGQELRWAVAGRNEEKLKAVLNELGLPQIPIILADGFDKNSLLAMTAQSQVICTTVGPYSQYGSLLVEACIETGTHYCDLCGEAGWVRKMIDQHHVQAAQKQLKIVHCCGFDSIPSDMGVYFLQKQIHAKYGQYARHIGMRLKAAKGGLSGGTFYSMLAILQEARKDRAYARSIARPYTLNPDPEFPGPDVADLQKVVYDPVAKSWIAPFVMASINTRVVRRSHALLGFPYGQNFTYEEAMLSGKGLKGQLKAWTILVSLGLIMAAKPGSLLYKLLLRRMPKPGEGPSQAARESGFFYFLIFGQLPDGQVVTASVKGDRDPGYGSTSKMLAECAVCLAKDGATLPKNYGLLTPSTAMGDVLLERLVKNAGLSFELK